MQPEEYDEYISDPVEFSYRKVLPRTIENLQEQDSVNAAAAMTRMGMELIKFGSFMRDTAEELGKLGVASNPMVPGYAPLDYISDYLRNIPNLILDLRKYPEKLKAAAEATVEPVINLALSAKNESTTFAFFPLHLNEYLSPQLFKEFYWPTLKEVILRLREEGLKSFIFFEGRHDAHLETILELPPGWGIAYFEKTDVREAKKLLEGHTCVAGGLPVTEIIGNSPEEIDRYIKGLMEDMKPGGGFILAPDIGTLPRETPVENIKAVYEAVERYAPY